MKKIKKSILILLLFVLTVIPTHLFPFAVQADNSNIIKIGAILPLTGNLSFFGQEAKNSLKMLEEKYKGKIKFVYQDSRGTAKDAVTVAQRLINVDKVKYILSQLSNVTKANYPICREKNIILMATTVVDADITKECDCLFRVYSNQRIEAKSLLRFIDENGYKRIALFHLNSSNLNYQISNIIIPALKQSELNYMATTFEFKTRSFDENIIKIKKFQPDLIFVAAYPQFIASIVKELHNQKFLNPPEVIGNLGFAYHLNVDPNLLNGIFIIAPNIAFQSIDNKIMNQYEKMYNADMSFDAAFAYDAGDILIRNILAHKEYSEIIKNMRDRAYEGASGTILIDESGDAMVDMSIGIYCSGRKYRVSKGKD